MNEIRPIEWANGTLRLLDQTRLPSEEVMVEAHGYLDAIDAIDRKEHTSELQSRRNLVCRLLLEKKKDTTRPVHLKHRAT